MKTLKYLGIALLAIQLSACFDSGKSLPTPGDNNQTEPPITEPEPPASESRLPYKAAIVTADSSYMGGAVQIASLNQNGVSALSDEVISSNNSDYTVSAFGDYFYHIGRFGLDNIAKYNINSPEQAEWSNPFDVKGGDSDANTYDLVFLNENKGYLIRYGSDKVWIVNPSATTESEFKLGELDLSVYDDGDGSPEPAAAAIVGDKLFVVMQRLNNWCPTEDAYVAVFDTKTDTEVVVNSQAEFKGIPLQVRNPSTIDYQQDIGLIVSGVGGGTTYCSLPNRYLGGIEIIKPGSYVTQLLLDDGDEQNHPYDFISSAIALDKNNGYFVSYVDWQDTKLYHFNPSTGVVNGVVEGFGNNGQIDIRILKKTPENTAWVGIAGENAGFYILDKQETIEEDFALERNPEAVAFSFEAPEPDASAMPAFPFAPKAGQEGSTAIAHDDPRFVAWATGSVNYQVGTEVLPSWQTPELALGYPGNSDGSNKGFTYDIVVLGRDGEITLTFDKPIKNGEGADFAVFENSFSDTFLELAWVEVSSDGQNFYRFPNYSFTEDPVSAYGATDPTMIHNLAGKYKGGFGTLFDLEDLKDIDGLDINHITHVKLIDIVGNGTALDSLGNPIYEAYPTVQSAGFDLDAVGVIHQAD